MRAHAACEETSRAKDGVHAWLGLVIILLSALGTAMLLGYAAWRWAYV